MRTSLFTALAAILSVAAALPTKTTLVKRQKADKFLLKPAPDAPAELLSLGIIQWDGVVGKDIVNYVGKMGWFPENSSAKDAQVFLQYNSDDGIAFYAANTALQVYLKPTWTHPAYQAKMGNPNFEPKPEWTLQNNFTIDTETVGDTSIEYFGYLHQYKDKWLACNDNGTYTIYFGGENPGNCVLFNIETEHLV
ncbi:uncharacterized protein H6S33_005701 [Morchella sextelata]|uniref:uncharacterized protein n=1 Tax=Morchella sextelata TaxID=1174677 RepID=UPI001D048DFA|nr:uncharacterized protein H6S33_005701 [Morchella sextelata]KAH0613815.1 hypothetical protein H6S33_005701 [Morchella sextelata]